MARVSAPFLFWDYTMDSLELSKPIKSISGSTINTLNFDFDSMSPTDYKQAVSLEFRLKGQAFSIADLNNWSKSTSSEFRIATAWIAALRGTEGLVLDDIDSISFKDLIKLESFAIVFFSDLE